MGFDYLSSFIIICQNSSKIINNHYVSSSKKQKLINNQYLSSLNKIIKNQYLSSLNKIINNQYLSSCIKKKHQQPLIHHHVSNIVKNPNDSLTNHYNLLRCSPPRCARPPQGAFPGLTSAIRGAPRSVGEVPKGRSAFVVDSLW
jgi:hypothetical protein